MIKTVKIKANGKINIGLNILGKTGNYHNLDSVLAEINLFDVITVTTRKDSLINLNTSGFNTADIPTADNNVYKAAKLFINTFNTYGADIKLQKNIPVVSGLGGSSADIVGTMKALAKAYGIEDDLLPLVRELCSDGEFLLNGGFARINGKGEVVERFKPVEPLYIVIAVPECKCNTAEVFSEYDGKKYSGVGADINEIVQNLKNGTPPQKYVFNALYKPASVLNPQIERIYNEIANLNPRFMSQSGSGGAVYGCFESVELCLWAKQKLEKICNNVFVKETIV